MQVTKEQVGQSLIMHANFADVTQINTWQILQNALLQTKYANHVERGQKHEVKEVVNPVLFLQDAVPVERKIMCTVELGMFIKTYSVTYKVRLKSEQPLREIAVQPPGAVFPPPATTAPPPPTVGCVKNFVQR